MDISWFMRAFAEPIARLANKQDQVTDRFWQARYRAVRLLDETAILACAAYVDLNPIRAAIAETLEQATLRRFSEANNSTYQQPSFAHFQHLAHLLRYSEA